MGAIEDKNRLLHQLKITEEEPKATGLTLKHLWLTAILSASLAGVTVFYLIDTSSSHRMENIRQSSPQRQISSKIESDPSGSMPRLPNDERNENENSNNDFQFSNRDEVLNASGYITARRIATVSSETMGLITSVRVEEGMKVKKGQVLATLDSSVATTSLQLANAQTDVLKRRIAGNRVELAEANRVLLRLKELDKSRYSSESQITKAQSDVDRLKSLLSSAKADVKVSILRVKQQQELLDKLTIRAPFSGVVTVKNAQPGEIVAPSAAGGGFTRTGICTIVDMGSLEIEVDVNEAYIGRVKKDQKVKANLDAYPQWDIPASVIAIIPTAERAKATVRVRIRIELQDSRILPDMGVKVAFLKD